MKSDIAKVLFFWASGVARSATKSANVFSAEDTSWVRILVFMINLFPNPLPQEQFGDKGLDKGSSPFLSPAPGSNKP